MAIPKLSLPKPLDAAVQSAVKAWHDTRATQRLWDKDNTLWTCADEQRWLGWLDIATAELAHPAALLHFAKDVAGEFRDVAVLGMGGSSLCPFVLAQTFGQVEGFPRLHVLDSTDPQQIRAFESRLDLPRTLFVVSSKSGSTLEPNILRDYFLARAREVVGKDAGRHFVAVTDPGSQLEKQAAADGFRVIFPGMSDVGGRFSALSNFGMVPGALAGIDIVRLLAGAEHMMLACHHEDPYENPGVLLGLAMGEAARAGYDKLTIFASPGISEIGAWLEQLIAESTGKEGKGIIPVPGEAMRAPGAYADDRLFVHIHLGKEEDPQDAGLRALKKAGKPVVTIHMDDAWALGAEFFRWEVATAVAGSLLHINPFDQPDVEAAKVEARRLTDAVERSGSLPAEEPFHVERGISLLADKANTQAIAGNVTQITLSGALKQHFGRLREGDYVAILAYVEMSDANLAPLLRIRDAIGGRWGVATTLGFGPRYLHSTGQAHKGGPNTGVFLQVTSDDAQDLPVPGRRYSFGTVKAAQARGDLAVLNERGRRALRVHLSELSSGLEALAAAVTDALT